MANAPTTTRDKALQLLGNGIAPEHVADACGVTASAISQLLADEEFAARVSELRYERLQKHNVRDDKYDSMEDKLADKLDSLLPLMFKPMEVLKAIDTVNKLKRRGSNSPDSHSSAAPVVQIIMPTQILQRFTTNSQNQVIKAGEQELLTIQSGTLLKQVKGEQNDAALARIVEST